MQPSHFDPVPNNGARRHWGVFTVIVPEDFGDQDVTWHLRHQDYQWSIPGNLRSPHYLLDSVDTDARNTHAPVVKFAPDDEGWRGRDGRVTGPQSVRVGQPLSLGIWVYPDPSPQNLVWWFKHQGPGDVTFSPVGVHGRPGRWSGYNDGDVFRTRGVHAPGKGGREHRHHRIPLLLDQRVCPSQRYRVITIEETQ